MQIKNNMMIRWLKLVSLVCVFTVSTGFLTELSVSLAATTAATGTQAGTIFSDSFETSEDSDGDGLKDADEIILGTDPFDEDSDDDGLKDGEEVLDYGTNPLTNDTDGDGASDLLEIENGTDPNDPDDFPFPIIPVDPKTIAPPLVQGETTTVKSTTEFLYRGPKAIQIGVNPEDIKAKTAALIRGKVIIRGGGPLPSVRVSILNHPEYGQTFTRADGMFDLVVNGGGKLVVNYQFDGYAPAQRHVNAKWNDWAHAEDVALVPLDSVASVIDLTQATEFQVARASVQTDVDGSRQATLLFPAGTTAEMLLPDGSTQALSTLTVRTTEYTVGPDGPTAMPAPLPATNTYTYAAELSVDEALAAGATDVHFNQEVFFYIDNFLDIPVGSSVPVGFYNEIDGIWEPSKDGLVISIISETSGMADIDIDGDGVADDPVVLAAELGFSDAERQQLATLYDPGDSLWRAATTHFSTIDCNFNPRDGLRPPYKRPRVRPRDRDDDESPEDDPCKQAGSIIECQSRVLRERIPITGTGLNLNYRSDRAFKTFEIDVTITPAESNGNGLGMTSIIAIFEIAGQREERTYVPQWGLEDTFTWDGMDAFGRRYIGAVEGRLTLLYDYPASYLIFDRASGGGGGGGSGGGPSSWAFGRLPTATIEYPGRSNGLRIGRVISLGSIGGFDTRSYGTGGWLANVHHAYDSSSSTLQLGTGETRSANSLTDLVVRPVIGGTVGDAQRGLDIDKNGVMYLAKNGGIQVVYPKEMAAELGRQYDFITDPANPEWLVLDLKIGPNGNIWFVSYVRPFDSGINQIGYVTPQGELRMLIDDLPEFSWGLEVTDLGGVYVTQTDANEILYYSPIVLAAANPSAADGVPIETTTTLWRPYRINLDKWGRLYVISLSRRSGVPTYILRVEADGRLTTVAGGGSSRDDGVLAIDAEMTSPTDIVADDVGGFFIANGYRIQHVNPIGIISTIAAGTKSYAPNFYSPWGQKARDIYFQGVDSIHIGPDGNMFASVRDGYNWVVKLEPSMPGFSGTNSTIVSSDGVQMYEFSSGGKHLRTLDATTGQVLLNFVYDADGHLSSINDQFEQKVSFDRDATGLIAITTPEGLVNRVVTNENDWITRFEDPGGNGWNFTYDAQIARLSSMQDRNGEMYQYGFDAEGNFVTEQGPDNSILSLSHSVDEETGLFEVELTDRNNLMTTYRREYTSNQDLLFTNTYPEGGVTTIEVERSGLMTRSFPTGTEMTVQRIGGPRFGMEAPLSNGRITTPGGRRVSFESTRSVSLNAPYTNPLNVNTLTSTWSMGSQTITTTFETDQHTLTLSNSAGLDDVFSYDADWNLSGVTRAGLLPQIFNWDDSGQVVDTSIGKESLAFTFDQFNKLASVTNAAGQQELYGRNASGFLNLITLPSGETLAIDNDANGNPTQLTMPNGAAHSMTYNPVNLLTSYADPLDNTTTMAYDLGRRRVSALHADGTELTNIFDSGGRIDTVSYDTTELQFSYITGTDLLSTLARTNTGGDSQSLTYTWDGHLQTGTVFSGTANGTFTFDYDSSMRLNSIQLDAEPAVVDVFDNNGLLTAHGPFSLLRDAPTNLPASWDDTVGNLQFEHDGLGRTTRRWNEVNGSVIYDLTLSWNNVDQIVSRVETVAGNQSNFAYTYDANGALKTVTIDGLLSESYEYDENGNRTSADTIAATYDSADRVMTVGTTSYGWDDNGFLESRGNDSFSYSVRGELLSATIGANALTFNYDGLGRLVSRTQGLETTQYLYGNPAALHLVTHSRAADNTLTSYFYDESGLLHAFDRGGQRYYVAVDQVGSPRVISDASGALVREIKYTAWGETLSDSNPGFKLAIGFAGGIADPTTGLVRFMLRDYDPASGRWTARDPARFDAGVNFYMYANSNPISFRDPTGLVCMGASAYAGVGGGVTGCYRNGEWSLCSEVGAGIGGGLTLNPFGKVARTERFVKVKAGVGVGPILGMSTTLKYTDCGRTGCPPGSGNCLPTADHKVGCTIAFGDCKGGLNLAKLNDPVSAAKNGKDVFKLSAKATATVGTCAKF